MIKHSVVFNLLLSFLPGFGFAVGSKRITKFSSLLRKSSSRNLLSSNTHNDPQSRLISPSKKFSTRSQAREQFLPSPVQSTSTSNGGHRSDARKPSFLEKLDQCTKNSSTNGVSGQQKSQVKCLISASFLISFEL